MAKKKKFVKKMRNELLDEFLNRGEPFDEPEVWAAEWCKAAYAFLERMLSPLGLGPATTPPSVALAIHSLIDEEWMTNWFFEAMGAGADKRQEMIEKMQGLEMRGLEMRGLELLSTTDVTKWAKGFVAVVRDGVEIDEGLMVGWFANAMCVAVDAERKKIAESLVGYPVTIDVERLDA